MKLSLQEKIAYGLGDTASNLVFMTVINFLLFYYTDIFGLSAAAVGTLFLVVRSVDAVVDVAVGVAADRTNTRWGKFRPWLLWTAGPLTIISVLTFTTPDWSPGLKLVYAWATYLLLMVAYSMINIPYGALSAVMTDDLHERTALSGMRMACAQVGGLIVAAGTLPLIAFFSGGEANRALGYQRTMMVFATMSLALFLLAFLGTRERIHPSSNQAGDLRADLAMLAKNGPWIVLSMVSVLAFIIFSLRQGAVIYYYKYYLGHESAATLFFIVSSLAAIPGALLAAPLSHRLGKRETLQLGAIACSVFTAAIFLIPPGHPVLLQGANALSSLAMFLIAPMIFSMLGDTADYADWKFRRRSTGIVFSAASFSMKVGMGAGGALGGLLLGYFGYLPGREQSVSAVRGIVLMLTLLPAAGYLLLVPLMRLYRLDAQTSQLMRAELALRRNQTDGS